MKKNYPNFKFFYLIIFLFFTVFSYSQAVGDYRSNGTGNWTDINSWEYYNGTSWVTPTGISPQGYPGQYTGTGAVLIQVGHMITMGTANLTTSSIGTLTINGTLALAGTGSGANFTINTQNLIITSGLTPYANISFTNKVTLSLPINVSIQVGIGGLPTPGNGTCNHNIKILIGTVTYAYCTGGSYDFTDLINDGGYNTVKTTVTSSPACGSGTFTIDIIAAPKPTASTTYNWYSSDGTQIAFQTSSSTPYSSSFTTGTLSSTTTYYVSATTGSNTTPRKAVTLTVNPLPIAPTIGTITQPTCSTATGSVVLSGLPAGNWIINPGSITGNTTSTTISGLAAGTYTYTVTNAAGCTSLASANVVINAQPANNTWIGTTSDWNNSTNWSCGTIPDLTTDVIIPVVTAPKFYPVINPIPANFGKSRNIELATGVTLTIENNYIQIAGILKLNGKIDLNSESQLLQDSGSTVNIASTGSIEIDQQGTGNSYRYNYWSSPVNSRGTKYTIGEVLKDGTVPNNIKNITFGAAHTFADGAQTSPIQLSTYWMYVLRNSGLGYSAWFRVGDTGEIAVGEGYTMKGSNTSTAEQNYTFVGKPNNGNITLPLSAGFNYLVGNPYPSAIDADQFLLDNATSITGAIYFWEHYGGDTHNLAGYQAGYATYNLSTGVPASSHPNVSITGSSVKGAPKRYIPVAQAFFVVGGTANGNIYFNNGQRKFIKESSGNSIFMKSSNTSSKTAISTLEDLRPKFRIGFDAPQISHRQLLLTVDERATPDVDWGFDAEIYEIFADDMYWMLNNKKYVIQGTNAIGLDSEVPLGIQLSKTGMVTVKIDELENVDDDTNVYLKDKLTGETFNIKDKPVQLNLTSGNYTDRFAITFKISKLVAEDVATEVLNPSETQPINQGIHVYMNNAIGELQIKNNSDDEVQSVALINYLGQTVMAWNSNFNRRTISLPIRTPTGIYNVKIITKNGTTVKKIMVK